MFLRFIEKRLEKTGKTGTTQVVRLIRHYTHFDHLRSKYWLHRAITIDIQIRETVQREIRIRKLYISYTKSATYFPLREEEQTLLETWEEELEDINKTYWCLERELECITSWKFQGPLRRAYIALHSNPVWYLSARHREECVRCGRCCARDCGCCERPRDTHRERKWGHCTDECLCCIRMFGGRQNKLGYVDDLEKDRVSFALERAYIWGI